MADDNPKATQDNVLVLIRDTLAIVCLIQGAVGLPSIIIGTERLYDVSGALAFLAACVFSLVHSPAGENVDVTLSHGPDSDILLTRLAREVLNGLVGVDSPRAVCDRRQLILTGFVALWALRLGSFLFARILRDGKDTRFDTIRGSPLQFTMAWIGQVCWVACCAMPVICINAVPPAVLASFHGLSILELLGLVMAMAGFATEVAADYQRAKWRREKRERKHDEVFMSRGLFSRSRYPHYFGDITFWFGVATAAFGLLWPERVLVAIGLPGNSKGRLIAFALSYISPLFAYIILTRVSGIPLSEGKYNREHGHHEDYKIWKSTTPRLVPRMV